MMRPENRMAVVGGAKHAHVLFPLQPLQQLLLRLHALVREAMGELGQINPGSRGELDHVVMNFEALFRPADPADGTGLDQPAFGLIENLVVRIILARLVRRVIERQGIGLLLKMCCGDFAQCGAEKIT